jgi:hypothetical protein
MILKDEKTNAESDLFIGVRRGLSKRVGDEPVRNFPCQTLKISKVSLVVMESL